MSGFFTVFRVFVANNTLNQSVSCLAYYVPVLLTLRLHWNFMNKFLYLIFAFLTTAECSWAAIQSVEPDNYASGADIIYPGVTLEMRNYQIPFTVPVMSVELGANYSSTGIRNFGGGFYDGQQFVAIFKNPISYFAIDVVNDDQGLGSDSAILAAYDITGKSLGYSDWVTIPATPWPGFKTLSFSGSGIAKIEVISSEWIQLDNLRFSELPISAVPEPAQWGLLVVGLSVLGLRFRQSKSAI